MIRRISKKNDLRDLIKSCPSGVVDDIYAIDYYIQGYNETIQGTFEKKGNILEVILPSADLETLPNGILMRRAYYKVLDASYPDGYYNLEFEDNMNVWLCGSEVEPGPSPEPGEYVTEEELAETLEDYATIDYVDEAISDIPSPENVVQYDLDHPLIEDFGLNVDVLKRNEFDYGSDVMTKGLVLSYKEYKVNDEVKEIDTLELRGGQLWSVNYDKRTDYHETRDPFVTESALESVLAGDENRVLREDDLDTYAQMSWVEGQGYITSSALSGYATQEWVNQQGFASDSDLDALDARVSVLEHGGGPSSVAWGGISGTVTDQSDLVNYIGSQGYITSSDLSTALSSYTESSNTFVFSEFTSQSMGIKTGSTTNGYSVALNYVTVANDRGKAVVIEKNPYGDYADRYVRAGIGTYSYTSHTQISFDPFVTETGMSTALSGYATETYVDQAIEDAVFGSEIPVPTVFWGDIQGTVTDQSDLVNYIGSQGYITSSALSGYATESWATSQFLEESKVWSGTQAQWNQLSAAQQASYTIALITQ